MDGVVSSKDLFGEQSNTVSTQELFGGDQKSALSRSAIIAHNVDSDKYAQNRKAMTDKGIPESFASPANKPPSMDGMLSTIKDFLGLSGKTAEHMSDPDFAKVAKDDHPVLTRLEDMVTGFPKRLYGAVEAGESIVSGIGGAIGGAATGLTTLALTKGDTEAAKAVQEGVSNVLTYHPMTEVGKEYTEMAEKIAAIPSYVGHELSEEVAQQWNAPEWLRYIFNTAGDFGGYALADVAVRGAGAHIKNVVDTAKESKLKARDPEQFKAFVKDVAGDSTVQAPLAVVDDILTKAKTTPEEALSDPTAYYEQKFEGMASETPVKADIPIQDVATLSDHITPEHIKDMSVEGIPSLNEAEALKAEEQAKTQAEGDNAVAGANSKDAEANKATPDQPAEKVEGKQPITSESIIPESGQPFEFSYIRNTEKSSNMGKRFGQDVEPTGEYMTVGNPENIKNNPKMKSGVIKFDNPLVIDFGGGYGEPTNWKNILSEKYDGKTGKELSKAIQKDGYDGIVTISKITKTGEPYTSEIVSLKSENKAQEAKPKGLSAEMKGADETADPLKTTGIKNAETNADLAERGDKRAFTRTPVEEELRRGDQEVFDKATQKMQDEPSYGKTLAEDIANKPRALTAEEVYALTIHKMRLMNEETRLMTAKDEAIKAGDTAKVEQIGKQLQTVMDDLNTVYEASRLSGYESGLGFRARQMMIKADYSLARTLARMKEKNKGKDITPEQTKQIEELTKQLNEATKKLSDYEESASKKQAEKQVNKIKRDVDASDRKAKRKETKEALDAKFEDLSNQLKKVLSPSKLSAGIDPTAVPILAKMAENRIRSGIVDVDALVDNIHEKVKDVIEGVTKRDIRDAISGYGKTGKMSQETINVALREAKRQMRLISALEDATKGEHPLRSGLQRDAVSNRVRELQREINQAMKESGIDSSSAKTPEEKWKTSLDAVKTRLKNSIADLAKRMETGKAEAKKLGIKYDEQANDLVKLRDKIKEVLEFAEGKKGNKEMSPEQRIRQATSAVEKSIAEYERRLNENDLTPKKKTSTTPETSELKSLRAERDLLKDLYKTLQDEAKTPKDPEASRLKAYKTRLTNRIAEMENQIETGNFEKTKKASIELDQEAMGLKEKQERLKTQIEDRIREQEKANRTWGQKTYDFVRDFRRFVLLAGVKVLGKLTAAATSRFATTPMESLMGQILELAPPLRRIGEKATREGGGFNVSAEAKGLKDAWQKKSFEDMKQIWKTGLGELDVLYGDRKYSGTPELLGSMGRIHSIFKVLPKKAEFYRSMEIIGDWYHKNGFDLNDPTVQARVAAESYIEANRAIFMNDNLVVNSYKAFLNTLKSTDNKGATAAALAFETEFPLIKVASNFADETLSYTAGGLRAIPGLKKAAIKGIDSLSPKEANFIMRNLKKNALAAFVASAVFSGVISVKFGGYYEKGEKRDPSGPGPGEITIGGKKVPKFMGHIPIIEAMQVFQTVKNAYDAAHFRGEGTVAAEATGVMQGAYGVAEHVPFVGTTERDLAAFASPEGRQKWFAQLAASLIIPPDVGALAREMDNDAPRTPSTTVEAFKNVIPGLRKDVPLNKNKIHREIIGQLRGNKPLNSYQRKVYSEATKSEQNTMDRKAEMTPMQEAFSSLSPEKAKKTWPMLTPKQKIEVGEIYEKKIDNAESKE